MSRPRSADPSVALSIAVPQSLKTRLDQVLSYKQSRSKWVCHAINEKLNQEFDYTSIPTNQLLGMLHARNVVDYELFTLLKTRVEEIEAAR
jgi:metal-responsive CopG/Arc/MetJ family transcriptional regulator